MAYVRLDEELGALALNKHEEAHLAGRRLHEFFRRRWRHLDFCQFSTVVEANIPGIRFADGHTKEVAVDWAKRLSRVTKMMEIRVIETLRTASSHSAAARLLGMGRGQLEKIMKRAVSKELARREKSNIPHVEIDEKAMRCGHLYLSVMTDIGKRSVDLAEERTMGATDVLWGYLNPGQRLFGGGCHHG